VIGPLAFSTTLGCVVVALVVAVSAVMQRWRWRSIAPTLLIIQLAIVVQAAADAISLASGHRVGELATHIAYLAASLVVLPAAATQTAHDDGRWAALLLVVALLVLAVIVVRMQTTWRIADA
jgi:hypothetical protein